MWSKKFLRWFQSKPPGCQCMEVLNTAVGQGMWCKYSKTPVECFSRDWHYFTHQAGFPFRWNFFNKNYWNSTKSNPLQLRFAFIPGALKWGLTIPFLFLSCIYILWFLSFFYSFFLSYLYSNSMILSYFCRYFLVSKWCFFLSFLFLVPFGSAAPHTKWNNCNNLFWFSIS